MREASPISRPGRLTRLAQNLGLCDKRNMVWSWAEPVNFGDWIGPFIYEARCGVPPLYHRLTRKTGGAAFVTVGSIMAHIQRDDAAIVWGAGIISRLDRVARPREIRAVRGPLTRGHCLELGYGCPDVFGDPAILLPEYLDLPGADPRYDLGVVPHFVNYEEAVSLYGTRENVRVVDVRGSVSQVVAGIRSCRATVSSSLHGLIVSHIYGLPSAWVKFTGLLKGDDVKFHDYYLAGGVSEPPAAVVLSGGEATADLVALARSGAVPDNDALKQRLVDACPF